MVAGHPPFGQASPKDPHYKALAMGNTKAFWTAHSRRKPGGEAFFSAEFKDLCEGIWKLDPNDRFTMAQIKSHTWYDGPTPSPSEIYTEFAKRDQANEAAKEAERAERKGNPAVAGHGPKRDGTGKLAELSPMKTIKQYERLANGKVILSNHEPDAIEAKILQVFS